MNVDVVGAVRMSGGKLLFHAVGPATENARLPSWRLVRGTRTSPRATERRAEGVATVVTGTHSSFIYLYMMDDDCVRFKRLLKAHLLH